LAGARRNIRLVAVSLNDPHSRTSLLAIADDYEKLAVRAEERSKREKPNDK